ncbi:hypothetical protein HPY32_20510 [Nocardia terpenica]|nr:hypothetical protein [Nocardia terpenica]
MPREEEGFGDHFGESAGSCGQGGEPGMYRFRSRLPQRGVLRRIDELNALANGREISAQPRRIRGEIVRGSKYRGTVGIAEQQVRAEIVVSKYRLVVTQPRIEDVGVVNPFRRQRIEFQGFPRSSDFSAAGAARRRRAAPVVLKLSDRTPLLLTSFSRSNFRTQMQRVQSGVSKKLQGEGRHAMQCIPLADLAPKTLSN